MATLIQSKQIEGIVTASIVEGQFTVSGSIIATGSESIFGAITASAISSSGPIYGVRYGDIQNTPNFIGGTGIVITQTGNNITITNTGGGGGASGSAELISSVAQLESYTGSNDIIILGLQDFTSSIQSQVDSLISATSSYETQGRGIISGSDQITSSLDSRYALSGSAGGGVSSFTELTNVPGGLLSSSQQITDLGFISESSSTDISSLNTFTSSIQSQVDGLSSQTSSYLTELPSGTVSGSTQITDGSGLFSGSLFAGTNITINQDGNNFIISSSASGGGSIPAGTISGSAQITALGFTSGSHTDIPTGTISGSQQISDLGFISSSHTDISSLNQYTSSTDGRIDSLEQFTSSLDSTYATDTELSNLSASIATDFDNIVHTQIPTGTISGSSQLTASYDTRYALSGSVGGGVSDYGDLTNVPSNIISGSQQITDLGFISSSHTDISSLNDYTASNDIKISNLESTTSSLEQRIGQIELNTSSYESHSDLSSLNTFSSSIQTEVDGLSAQTASYLTSLDGGIVSSSEQITALGFISESSSTDISSLNSFTSSIQTQVDELSSETSSYLTELPSGTVSGSSQLTSSYDTRYALSGSVGGGSADVSYNGNRIISNEDLGDLFTNSVNPGTSGSIQDFLNAVFYPNTGPSITTGNQTISEYVTSGSSIVTLTGTDPEGQTITFGTASSYTDDLVRVESGVLKLNALAESSSFNTDSVGGSHGHLVTITATDTFDTTTEKDIYVIVTPNEAPKFREGSASGNVITSVSSNLNENSTNNTLVKRVYFTDAEGDSITIHSSSIDNDHFDITKYSNYVDIRQNTSSLDYEAQSVYTFSISASDEHYEAGQDSDSIVTLPITVNVTDNQTPTVSNQTLSSINENSSNGATVGTISATDNESDTITFKNFELHQLLLDGSNVSSGSYSGTSQASDPHENPFQMNSSGVVTRKTGIYLNSDLINRYIYRVQVTDSYNVDSAVALVTINITDDTPATLSDNWTAGPYIKESEVSGTTIKRTNYGSDTADYDSNQSGTWSSSNSAISINSSGNLSLGIDLSGSVTQSGDTLDSTITFTNTFGTTTTDSLSVTIVANSAPTATFTNQSSNFNTNLATDGTTMVSMSISDTEGDTPYSVTLGGSNAGDLQLAYTNSNSSSVGIQADGNLSAGTYNYDVTVTDSYSKSTTYSGRSFTIASIDTGTLSTNGTFYVIESATNGDNIVLNSNGRTGTQGSVSVSYSPNYGSQSAGSFTSSNNLISINSSTGVLSVGNDISGSGNTNGDTITSTIGWTDQYGNNGSDTITINVTENNGPTVSGTSTSNLNTNQARSTNQILQLTISDTEGDTIPNSGLVFSGYNTTYFTATSSTPYMRLNVNSTNVPAGTYPYTASLSDEHGFSTNVISGSFTITQSDTGTLEDDVAIYIIESAESGSVFRDQTGFSLGSPAQVSVSYSPNDGSATVQAFTSSNEAIVIDSSGNLTLGLDLSGSVTQSGDTFTSTITFNDQYGNSGSGSVTATVFGNSSPSANFTDNSLNSDEAISGSDIGTLTVTDTESNSPFSITLAGTDGGKFDVSGSSSPFTIEPTGSLSAGSYSINITVTDSYGESVTLTNESIVVSQAADYGKVYIYTSTRTGGGTLSNGNYDGILGITSEDTSAEPDLITGYQSTGPSPIYAFKTGYLGSGSITVGGGSLSLRNTVSGSNLDTIISSSFNGDGSTAEQIMIIFPSGSDMGGIPTSMTDTLGGSTDGEYVLYLKAAGESSFTAAGTQIHMFDVDSSVNGYSRWNILGRNSVNTAASFEVRLIPSSGSAP